MADTKFRVAFFSQLPQADSAVRNLLAAGFTKKQISVICPEPFAQECLAGVKPAEHPGSHAIAAMVEGGAVGAAIGGVALVATAIATGGVGLLPAIPVLLGGGAIAGGFSALIVQDGYGKEIGNYYEEAIRLGRIVVGVKEERAENTAHLDQAERILAQAGGVSPAQMHEATPS